jgi:putative AdoMet-dependent methyltransferase
MISKPLSEDCFDRWAASYDEAVACSPRFPLAGYEAVLDRIVSLACVSPGMSVLDLGTGTGNLAGLFSQVPCEVWATDFSTAMLDRARRKYPDIHLGRADIRAALPLGFPKTYDRIVSAYAFHHLELDEKVRVVRDLTLCHLAPNGRIVIGDVSFKMEAERAAARIRLVEEWDAEEYYWAADETREALRDVAVELRYTQVSSCGGVFIIEPVPQSAEEILRH